MNFFSYLFEGGKLHLDELFFQTYLRVASKTWMNFFSYLFEGGK
jgi:hypothetical protein